MRAVIERHVAAADVLAQTGIICERVREATHLAHGFAIRLSLLAGEQRSQILFVARDLGG